VSYTHRMIGWQVAQIFPQMLQQVEQPQQYQATINQLRDSVLNSAKSGGNVVQGLLASQANLLQMASADGMAIYAGGTLQLAGKTPAQDQVQQLVNIFCDQYSGAVFKDDAAGLVYTSNLVKYMRRAAPSSVPLAQQIKDTASGLLVIPISRSRTDYLLLFRTEQPTECVWGGNPDKSMLFADKFNPTTLSPRSAFNAWKQLVTGTSIAWIPFEVEAISYLRNSLVEIN